MTDNQEEAVDDSARAVMFRPAGPRDAYEMARLAQTAYESYVPRIGREPAPMTADYVEIASGGNAWVALQQQGRVIGLLVLEPHADYLLLDNVAVDPEHQGVGVGGRLLDLAEEQAQARGLSEVRLFTNEAMTENLEFYLRRGYAETHRATQNGYRRVFFTKRLATTG